MDEASYVRPERTLIVSADACPQLPLRVLGLVAQRGLIAKEFQCRRKDAELKILLTLDGDLVDAADLIANRIRGMIAVRHVELLSGKNSGPL